jgi:hypothetical protein
LLIERALRKDLELDDFHESARSAVLDYLLPGRRVVWLRYEPGFGKSVSIPIDSQNDPADDQGDIEPGKAPNNEKSERL